MTEPLLECTGVKYIIPLRILNINEKYAKEREAEICARSMDCPRCGVFADPLNEWHGNGKGRACYGLSAERLELITAQVNDAANKQKGNNLLDSGGRFSENGVADYLPFIRARLIMLGSLFDESERDDQLDPIAVAGYVFKPKGYEAFRKHWRKATRIGARRFYPFHMTDLVAGKNVYKGVSIPDRVILLNHAVDAVTTNAYCGVGVYFDKDEFEAVAPPEWPLIFGSIYGAACQLCVQLTAHHLTTFKRCHLGVLYTFEQGHLYEDEVDRYFKDIRKDDELRKRFLYRNHVFEEKHKECGLQAADLLAWTTTKLDGDRWKAKSFGAFVDSIARLGGEDERQVRYMKITGDRLVSFIKKTIASAALSTKSFDLGRHKRAFR